MFPYNEKVKVNVVTYRLEIFHEGFVFSVYVSDYQYKMMIESIRILDDKDEWRKLKYSIKHVMTNDVEEIANQWIRTNLSHGR
jgi:hypothetical protein